MAPSGAERQKLLGGAPKTKQNLLGLVNRLLTVADVAADLWSLVALLAARTTPINLLSRFQAIYILATTNSDFGQLTGQLWDRRK